MLKIYLRLLPAAAGVLAVSLFTACAEPAAKRCEGDDCDSAKDSVDETEADTGPAKDAGKKDAGSSSSKDSGAPVVVDAGPSTAALVHLPCDVKTVVDKKCGLCHGSDPSAPMSLVTAADFQALTKSKQTMYASAKDKINATIPSEAMPPASAEALTDSEKATLNAWFTKGAPGVATNTCASADAGPAPDAPYVTPTDDDLECHRMLAHNGDGKTPLNVGIADDVYYAYTFAAPWKEMAYGVVIRTVVDNKKALHHWLLFQDNVPGIPSGAIPQIGAHPTGQLLAVWAPGADDMDFRKTGKEVALELPADTTYTVEFHYNSSDPNAKDASGVEVCVAKQKPKNIAAYSWVGQDNLGIPSTKWVGTCSPLSAEPIHIVSFMPHMHLKGIHMKGTINRKDGTKEVVHDKPFDFNFQRSYAVDLTMNPGDTLTTECDYSAPAVFGQPTDQEMCYLFAMAYPKGALAAPDVWGTVAHGASSCLGQ